MDCCAINPPHRAKECKDKHFCISCNRGYRLDSVTKRCIKKKPCTCAGGTALKDIARCDGQPHCVRCNRGYRFDKKSRSCLKNQACACKDGSPFSGPTAATACNAQNYCVKCTPGFHLGPKASITSGKQKGLVSRFCLKNKPCTCVGGPAVAWDGNGQLATLSRTGFRQLSVSSQCRMSDLRIVPVTVSCRMHSPCHAMSHVRFLRNHVGSAEKCDVGSAQCPFTDRRT